MSREPSSAPSWFPVHDDRQPPEAIHTWRRITGDESLCRPKTIPLAETWPAKNQPENSGTQNVVSIDRQPALSPTTRQRDAARSVVAVILTELQFEVLEVIEEYGGIAKFRLIREEIGDSRVKGCIHRLHCVGVIEPVQGRGYRITAAYLPTWRLLQVRA